MINPLLLDALRKHSGIYDAILPYNLNWEIDLNAASREFLRGEPIVVVDVGAREGSIPEMRSLETVYLLFRV